VAPQFQRTRGAGSPLAECLQEFNFDVQHRKGKLHSNTDSLSQYPEMPENGEQHQASFVAEKKSEMLENGEKNQASFAAEKKFSLIAALDASPVLTGHSPADIQELQLADEVLGPLMSAIEAKQKARCNTT